MAIRKPNDLLTKYYILHFRLIRNPLGSTHPEATLKACLEHGAPDDAIQAAKAEFHAHLAANRSQQAASSHDLVEDAELMAEDREIDGENQGNKSFLVWSREIKYIEQTSFIETCWSLASLAQSRLVR